jgi:ABC-type transport system involved in multi-copper enzyme maturation permease subunit
MSAMNALWSITKNTLVQTIRQPLFGLILLVMLVMLTLAVPLSGWTMGPGGDYETTDQLMLQTVGLSILLFWGMVLGALTASSAVGREIRDGTALTVASKPVSRAMFVLGKFLGTALAVTLGMYITALAFILAVRHGVVSSASAPIDWPVIVIGCSAVVVTLLAAAYGNYAFGWSFLASTVLGLAGLLTAAVAAVAFVGKGWTVLDLATPFGEKVITGQLLVSLWLIYLAVLLLSSIAVMASTRLGMVMTLLLTAGVLIAGAQWGAIRLALGKALPGGEGLAYLLPNLTAFFPLDSLARDAYPPAELVSLYFLCYVAAIVLLGMALFQTRPLDAREGSSTLPGAVALLSGLGRIAAVVLLIGAAVSLTQPSGWTGAGLAWRGGAIALSVGLWILFTAFARRARWSWWVLVCIAGLSLLRHLAVLAGWSWSRPLRLGQPESALLLTAAISAVVLVMLMLSKTRHHFDSSSSATPPTE